MNVSLNHGKVPGRYRQGTGRDGGKQGGTEGRERERRRERQRECVMTDNCKHLQPSDEINPGPTLAAYTKVDSLLCNCVFRSIYSTSSIYYSIFYYTMLYYIIVY